MEKTAPRDGGHTEFFHQKLRERHIILTELADVRDDVVGPGGHDGAKSRLTQDVQHAISLALVHRGQVGIVLPLQVQRSHRRFL